MNRFSVAPNAPCPCGKGKNANSCHGRDDFERLAKAIHEIGHAAMSPPGALTHVSFLEPCPLCSGAEKRTPGSEAHMAFKDDFDFSILDLLMLAVAGGATEVACGLRPTYVSYDIGEYPDGMLKDFDDLKADMTDREQWHEVIHLIAPCFQLVVEHCKEHVPLIQEHALKLLEHDSLTADQLDFGSFKREELFKGIMDVLDEDENGP